MKTKIISFVLVLCILCAALLTGCGQESPYQVVDGAIKKTSALDSAEMTMDMTMGMVMDGSTISVPITAEIKGKGLQTESPVVDMDMTMSMLGQKMTISMYQEGEWAYMSMMGANYKAKVSDLGGQYDYAQNANDMVKPLPEEFYKDANITEKDGTTTAVFKLDEKAFNKYYSDFLSGLNETTQTGPVGDVKITNAVITIAVKSGYVETYGMAFKMEYQVEGEVVAADVDVVVKYKNAGKAIEVTPPEGYEKYEELDMSDLMGDIE